MAGLTNIPDRLKNVVATIYGFYNSRRKYRGIEAIRSSILARSNFTRSDWKEYQDTRLNRLLYEAKHHVPYYVDYWSRSYLDWKVLQNWPIIEKEMIRGNENKFISDKYRKSKLIQMFTSGSSGRPMCYYLSPETFNVWYSLYDLRIKEHHGVDLRSDAYASFGGRILFSSDRSSPPFWVWNYYNKQLYCSSYHLSDETIPFYIEEFERRNIKYLVGYVSAIHSIATYIIRNKVGHNLALKVAITNAEPLSDLQRCDIEQGFNCKVVETYSGCEYAFGGNEMYEGQMVLWPEAGVLEVETSSGKMSYEGFGEFIATGLINFAMPLIRFRIGDWGEIAEDSVNGFQYLKRIEGRVDDIVYTFDGREVGRMDPVFKDSFDIQEAQIVQNEDLSINVLLVKGPTYTSGMEQELKMNIKDRLGGEIDVKFQYVDEVPRGANGKFKGVISKASKN